MPSPIFQPEVMEHEVVVGSQHAGLSLPGDADLESRDEENQEALRFAFDQLTMMTTEKVDCSAGGLSDPLDTTGSISDACNSVGGGYVGSAGSLGTPTSCSSSSEYYGAGGYPVVGPQSHAIESSSALCNRKRGVNMTECVPVPSSEHVAEIVGRQGCKIKALRAKTNTYIKTPVRGEEPVFIVTGRREDVETAKREILSAAEHFSVIRASRCKAGSPGAGSPPHVPGQTTIQVRVPYRVVGLVVGPKGATIKRIQQQTHTYIVTPSRDKDPVFEVTGMPENVDRAREEIESHIAMRTGAFLDLQGDNDFHSNGTDVSLEGLGSLGLGSVLWSRARHQPASMSLRQAARKAGASSFGGALSPQMGAGSRAIPEGSSISAPFSATARYGFSGEVSRGPGAQPADELAFELGASNIWGPLTPGPQQRRDSGGLSGGSATPRLSPTLPPEPVHQEHPLSRRAQSDPLGALSWLQAGNAGTSFSGASSSSSGGSSTGYSSSCSGGSPTDSEGGVVASGLLGRLRGVSAAVGGSARDCSICFESEVTAALVPCGHNLFCMDCAGQICQSANPACPECHTPATQCIRIFS